MVDAWGPLRWFNLSRTGVFVEGETDSYPKLHKLSIDDLFRTPFPLRVSLYLIATSNLHLSLLLYLAFGTITQIRLRTIPLSVGIWVYVFCG